MIDHDWRSYDLMARAFDGNPGGLSQDDPSAAELGRARVSEAHLLQQAR
jgi:hypothetical protein